MDNYKEEISKIYRKTANLNLYASICNAESKEVVRNLAIIRDMADKLIDKIMP